MQRQAQPDGEPCRQQAPTEAFRPLLHATARQNQPDQQDPQGTPPKISALIAMLSLLTGEDER